VIGVYWGVKKYALRKITYNFVFSGYLEVFKAALHESDVILPNHHTTQGRAVVTPHDGPTLDDHMTYGYQIVDLADIYQNIYNILLCGTKKYTLEDKFYGN
jgi:hypothetical protein